MQDLQEWKRLWLLCASDAVGDSKVSTSRWQFGVPDSPECQCIGSQLARDLELI